MATNHSTKVETLTAGDLFSRTYSVPLYQREYAWGREEIWQLLDDLQESFSADPARNYHIGSLTAFLRMGAAGQQAYELIDGQQRTITLALLLRLLANHSPALTQMPHLPERLRFENRPDAESFLATFGERPDNPPSVPAAFRRAVDAMRDHPVFNDANKEMLPAFSDFVKSHVVLFLVTMPPETDVSAYFEIMNNRGIQLEYHELLKAKLIARLPNDTDKDLFDRLWTVSSHMDGRLADRLDEKTLAELQAGKSWRRVNSRVVKILETPLEAGASRSIIPDFPNFLLHVLRIHLRAICHNGDAARIPLDERQMRKVFDEHLSAIDPVHFLDDLLQMKLRFDQLVIKVEGGTDGLEVRWSLEGREDWIQADRERLAHLQSMLQVSFPSRRYKEWLSLLLCEDHLKGAPELIALLERFARERLREYGDLDSLCCCGTRTPHLALNLIDYLMYCATPEKYSGSASFRFAYRNSVEHHFPQGSENCDWTNDVINDIGNLYLLAKSDNSALNVRGPDQKVALVGKQDNLPPKRREMYRMTLADGWTPEVMRRHSKEIRDLLAVFAATSR